MKTSKDNILILSEYVVDFLDKGAEPFKGFLFKSFDAHSEVFNVSVRACIAINDLNSAIVKKINKFL